MADDSLAARAIARSRARESIVHLSFDPGEQAEREAATKLLTEQSEAQSSGNDETEYWGDGWRVHVAHEGQP